MVAKGYFQILGVDYDDTFSPVVKLTTLRLFVALAAVNDYELEQLDVTTAFLYWKFTGRNIHASTSWSAYST